MPLQATSGAASYDAFGGGVAAVPNYIEDVFSTWLYTGNDSTQTIPNGIDLSTKGGLVWTKTRNVAQSHQLVDTVRGQASTLISNSTNAASVNSGASSVNSFLTTGYVAGVDFSDSTRTYASWTFREQPKFFDVVTWTGNGSAQQVVSHSLGSAPGFITCKATSTTGDWWSYHRASNATPDSAYLKLNTTDALVTGSNFWGVTSTSFTAKLTLNLNTAGVTYVAYLFAHNAGGFGLTGTDNVISCGSYTGNDNNNGPEINLGWEPQWVMIKNATTAGNSWRMFDNMRGMDVNTTGSGDGLLSANTSSAEAYTNRLSPTATGFKITDTAGDVNSPSGNTFIYIAIRRGPMRTPTTGTSVFEPLARTGTGSTYSVTSLSFPPDLIHSQSRDAYGANAFYDRLRGGSRILFPNTTGTEGTDASISSFNQNGFSGSGVADYANNVGTPYVFHAFRRAPGFFDEVCYTGDGTANRNITHNLTVTPQLIFAKSRSNTANWVAYNAFGNGLILNSTAAANSGFNFITSATASTFTPADPASFGGSPNQSGQTYVAYLFATCPGVSKVGSYTGNGSTQTINCGFTGGARFVLIKRTDSTGDWYVYDTARGMTTLTDPYLLLNSTAAESATLGSVTTSSTGFDLNAGILAAINTNGASYIFLAIA